eukprot:gene5132-10259_t
MNPEEELGTIASLKKSIRLKKWSQVYTEKIETDHRLREDVIEKRHDDIMHAWALAIISRRFILKIRRKIEQSRAKNAAFNQIREAFEFTHWEPHLGTQLLCQICTKPGYNNCINCISCNAITHSYCLSNYYKANEKKYKCPECIDLYVEERIRHNQYVKRKKEEGKRQFYGNIIAKHVSSYMARRRFLKKRRSIVRVQALIRRFIFRRKFLSWRSFQMRVIAVEVKDLTEAVEGSTIVLTVVDTMKYTQIFRFDKVIDKFNLLEPVTFLLPGITKNVYIVITISSKDDVGQQGQVTSFKAQGQLPLKDIRNNLETRVFNVKFTNNVQWPPHAAHAQQGQPRVTQASSNLSHSYSNDNCIYDSCTLRLMPLNPVTNPCMQISGPPLDIMRRVTDVFVAGKRVSNTGERRSQWWICIAETKLYFYQFFGDAIPRHSVSLREATATIPPGTQCMLHLQLADKRKWQLDFSSHHETLQLAFAVIESRKILDHSSVYFPLVGTSTPSIAFNFY